MSVVKAVTQTVQLLSPEQQQQVLAYAQALHQKQAQASEDTNVHSDNSDSFLKHPAFGMWKDREDMKDSVEWVRQVRKTRWRNS